MVVFVLHALYSKCLLLFYFFTELRSVRINRNKDCSYFAKAPTCLFGQRYFQYSDFKLLDRAKKCNQIRSLHHHLTLGVWLQMQFHVSYTTTCTIQHFFLPKICFPCTYYEYITLLNRRRGGATMLFQGKVVILCQIKLGVNENPPFYQCARVNARANDARNTRS